MPADSDEAGQVFQSITGPPFRLCPSGVGRLSAAVLIADDSMRVSVRTPRRTGCIPPVRAVVCAFGRQVALGLRRVHLRAI